MDQLRTRRIDLSRPRGHHLYVVEAGRGPTVLLVHGAAGSWTNWSYQIRDLARTHRVVAPDLRGHGASPWPGESTVDDFYRDLEELVRVMDLPPRFAVAGHSFGGYLSTRLACDHADRVSCLALLNTSGTLPQGIAYRFLETFSGGADLVRQYYPWMVSTGSDVARCLMKTTLKQWDCWDMYPRLRMPALVVLGALDPLIPLNHGRDMARRLSGARVEVMSSGGHVSMVEQPAEVTSWLRDLLAEAEVSGLADAASA